MGIHTNTHLAASCVRRSIGAVLIYSLMFVSSVSATYVNYLLLLDQKTFEYETKIFFLWESCFGAFYYSRV